MKEEELIAEVQKHLEDILPEERLDFMASLLRGYCEHCGWEDPDNNCHCWNDE